MWRKKVQFSKQSTLARLISDVSFGRLPAFKKVKYLANPNKKRLKAEKAVTNVTTHGIGQKVRLNAFNIQMLSQKIYDQVFKNKKDSKLNFAAVEQCIRDLKKHDMPMDSKNYQPEVDFIVPPLEGKDIEEHFEIIGNQQSGPYRDIIQNLLLNKIPKPPDKWLMKEGWTCYIPGKEPESVSFPMEDGLVFDVEVCMSCGKAPTLATAVSHRAWYGWVSQSLIDGTSKPIDLHQYNTDFLIPLESTNKNPQNKLTEHMKKPKVVVGHNVSFDRARLKEQYWLEKTGTRFIDTMSLHMCVSGLTSYQRAVLKAKTENKEDEAWKSCSSLNSLDEVAKLYCGKTISKETRNLFVDGTLQDIRNEFNEVMKYCCNDVQTTYEVLKILFPMFLERFPHPVTLAGMLELSTAYLPINSNWNRYISSSDEAYEDFDTEAKMLLARRADQACQLLHQDKYKKDIWLWDQDWDVKNIHMKKSFSDTKNISEDKRRKDHNDDDDDAFLEKKFKYLDDTRKYISRNNFNYLCGYPNWYKKLCTKPDSTSDWTPGPHLISTSMRITPKLLSLTWEGYPLHYLTNKGWGFLVPFDDNVRNSQFPIEELIKKCPLLTNKDKGALGLDAMNSIYQSLEGNLIRKDYYSKLKKDKTRGFYKGSGIWCDTELENCCFFIKLPHKNGPNSNVGNPLSKDFLIKFSENILAGDTESAEKVISIAKTLSYWRNTRARIYDQMVVWLDTNHLPKHLQNGTRYGAIVPQVVVCGTLTRRAVEPTWMTASNILSDRVGSELRAMVQAPPGYAIIGADVDSQELWIASVIGDASSAKTHGATPFGWMTLSGNKTAKTDMHSVTAKAIGISREHAKVINYARIYGAGQNFAQKLLQQFNPSLSESEARSKAIKMFNLTKGKQIFNLKEEYLKILPVKTYSKWQAFEAAKSYGKSIDDLFSKPIWFGGTESAMFNRLEALANTANPSTPFLNGCLSRAIEPKSEQSDKYLPTRVNWVVQSGAVDFLHLMLVCMRWIMADNARFCLSFHDEVRYLVPEKHRYQAALAMHVTNLLTRTFCSVRVGINDLPQSVAFFSSVEVDKVLRKDSKQDCKTPSNPHGLEKGYNIPNGESLDIYEAIKKASGQFASWYESLKSK